MTAADQFDSDSTPNNNQAAEDDQDTETVTPNVADLSLTKTVDDSTPNRNQNVTFTLTVSNAGSAGATGVTVNDVLPAGLTFVSSTPSQGSFNSGTGVWTVGAVSSGANATLQIVATVTTTGARRTLRKWPRRTSSIPIRRRTTTRPAKTIETPRTVTPTVADLSVTKTASDTRRSKGKMSCLR